MDFQLSQEMKNRIEKNDQQERLDYDEMKEHAKLQLQEFYNARSKLLDNLPKMEPKESIETGVQDICLTNVANYIDLHRDGNDEKRSRMRSILAEYKKEKIQADLLK